MKLLILHCSTVGLGVCCAPRVFVRNAMLSSLHVIVLPRFDFSGVGASHWYQVEHHPASFVRFIHFCSYSTSMSLLVGTLFFIALGIVGALTAPLWAQNQTGLVKILSFLAAFCLWLSYALIYMSQLNPLLLPTRNLKSE